MTTWTPQTKNTASWTSVDKSNTTSTGTPIGLLLSLTRLEVVSNQTWTPQNKSSSTWTNQNKS